MLENLDQEKGLMELAKTSGAGVAYLQAEGTPLLLVASIDHELTRKIKAVIEEWENDEEPRDAMMERHEIG